MEILQLSIPPLPLFLTAGYSVWRPGMLHFERTFEVYDLLIVCSGAIYMKEQDSCYEVKGGEMLLLEPGRTHCGYLPCKEPTALYWVHFSHSRPAARMLEEDIPWSSMVRKGSDSDLMPAEQALYLPKHGKMEQSPLVSCLEDILKLRDSLTLEHAVDLQVALGRLLCHLQSGLRANRRSTRSYAIAEQVKLYLRRRLGEPFEAPQMAQELHYDFDYAARCLKKHTGFSPLQYVHQLRMEEAKRLLIHSTMSVQDIAAGVGISDYNYFIRLFRKTVGITPGAFRESSRSYV